jgi:elongation factor Ts
MEITAELVKELRDRTGISIGECKKALVASDGDMEKALAILSEKSQASVAKKADRVLGAGTVASYVHNTAQVGAMIVLSSETDFVSKNEEFTTLARDIAMHAAAMKPQTLEELLEQPFIKDPSKTIKDLVAGATQKFGERVELSKFACFTV